MVLAEENVWDYPRPPRLEPVAEVLRVMLAGSEIARTRRGWRVLETSHPPTYYFPPEDVSAVLTPSAGDSVCEWKGRARFWSVSANGRRVERAAWSYPAPAPGFSRISDHLAFYPGPMDRCEVGGVAVTRQPGDFYGGWITPNLRGPFKGAPGTLGW